jgi:hypothetical protein
MSFIRLIAGRRTFICGVFATGLLLGSAPARTTDRFPFDQELVLDAAPMRPGKRMPILTVAPDGNAILDLWCRTVSARVELSDAAIKIEPSPVPQALPEMMGIGQCTPERIQADQDLLDGYAQVTAWRNQGAALVLMGPKPLKFRPPAN